MIVLLSYHCSIGNGLRRKVISETLDDEDAAGSHPRVLEPQPVGLVYCVGCYMHTMPAAERSVP